MTQWDKLLRWTRLCDGVQQAAQEELGIQITRRSFSGLTRIRDRWGTKKGRKSLDNRRREGGAGKQLRPFSRPFFFLSRELMYSNCLIGASQPTVTMYYNGSSSSSKPRHEGGLCVRLLLSQLTGLNTQKNRRSFRLRRRVSYRRRRKGKRKRERKKIGGKISMTIW